MRPEAARPRSRRLLRGGLVALLVVGAAAGAGGLWVRQVLRESLPLLDGRRVLPGLSAPVVVERDALGTPTLTGSSRIDVARATGFVHAQDRFFQMDLLRRRAAGELAEIVGPAALPLDRRARLHRFRELARRVVETADPADRALVEAYASGVNQGLAALAREPFEYAVLRVDPAPWRPEDTVLVALAMFLDLNDDRAKRESTTGLLHELLPPPLAAFLDPRGTEWDAPLEGGPFEPPPIPGPEVLDVRGTRPVAVSRHPLPLFEDVATGSNNWAVAGSHTADGGALLANDMHLGLGVPNIWYRLSLAWKDDEGSHRVTGVTLPGAPSVIVGSNGRVAWGFTNTQADWTDLVLVETDPSDPASYRTPAGPRRFEHHLETLRVKGGADERLDVVDTIWGPVIDHDHAGRPRALAWIAQQPGGVNLRLARLETAGSLDQALALAPSIGVPPQNFVCVDASGRIGWTVIGRIPRRVGFDGRVPTSWADGSHRWDGWVAPGDYPRVVDPPSGRIWTANARVVGGADLSLLGEGNYVLGARARQIRDDLLAEDKVTPADMLRVQLDDRAVFLERWQRLLLGLLTPEALAGHPQRAEARREIARWGERASIDSVGYRLVRAFRITTAERVFAPLVAPCRRADPDFDYLMVWQYEGPLWRLVSERPPHLLDPRYRSWSEALLASLDAALDELSEGGRRPVASLTWGARNTVRIQHPLSRALPWLGPLLDMPREPLPGDSNMPRVQTPTHGASERLVVSPGRESQGLFHMPGGESGNPISPHYRDGHEAWARGEATPFLPGPPRHRLTLVPSGSSVSDAG